MSKYLVIFLSIFYITTLNAQTDITWDGGGLDNNWENPLNWDLDRVPLKLDQVIIPDDTVNYSTPHSQIMSLSVFGGSIFTIANGAKLVLSDSTDISTGDALLIQGTPSDSAQIINNGNLDILFQLNDSGINLYSNSYLENNGNITVDSASNATMILFPRVGGTARLVNNGTMTISRPDDSDVIFMRDNVPNSPMGSSILVNNGTLEAIHSKSDGAALAMSSNTTFINNYHFRISGVVADDDDAIYIYGNAVFRNNLLMEIDAIPSDPGVLAIESIEGATFENTLCGVINVYSTLSCEFNSSIDMVNDGIFTTAYTGLDNAGNIDNSGEVRTPSGTNAGFNITGGSVNSSPIPAISTLEPGSCPRLPNAAPIPTLSEWGVLLLGMIFIIFGVIGLRTPQKAKVLS